MGRKCDRCKGSGWVRQVGQWTQRNRNGARWKGPFEERIRACGCGSADINRVGFAVDARSPEEPSFRDTLADPDDREPGSLFDKGDR